MRPAELRHVIHEVCRRLGEASDFDRENGYYAQGVTSRAPEFAPADWKQRARPVRVGNYTGWCMEPHDLVLSKIGAGREKDLEFARTVAKARLVDEKVLNERLGAVVAAADLRMLIAKRIRASFL